MDENSIRSWLGASGRPALLLPAARVRAGGEAFPVAGDQAGEGAGGRGGAEALLRSAALHEFGQVTGHEGVAGPDSVHHRNGNSGLPEHRAVNQREGTVGTKLDHGLARPQARDSPGQVLGFTGAYGDRCLVLAGEHDVRQRDDVAVYASGAFGRPEVGHGS
jgi:hypothetical protein